MKNYLILSLLTICITTTVSAQQPASSFDRGSSLQAWQDSAYADVIAGCSGEPAEFRIGGGAVDNNTPPMPTLPVASSIPGVIQGGKTWQVVWSWEGNNADGPIAGENGTIIFANNQGAADRGRGFQPQARPRRIHLADRPFGLRQVHGADHGRRAERDLEGRDQA